MDFVGDSIEELSKEVNVEVPTAIFAVEFLPGQFDQRADSAAQCIQIISRQERPLVRSAKVYLLYGKLTEKEISEIRSYVINPVEAREASMDMPATLAMNYEVPTEVEILDGFTEMSKEQLSDFIKDKGLAMDLGDICFCQEYFAGEHRNPTITEIKMIDTYWSDHCRHTTFNTQIDGIKFEDELLQKTYQEYLDVRKELGRTKPVSMMDIGTLAAKYLKKKGLLDKLDESEEINACTVRMTVDVDGKEEPWFLLFKNETHNHPTEIEPFGGAATCVGGAIRDPLSGRAYVYGAMRVTGAADPLRPASETIKGKLPQRKIVTTAAAGYASYGNQIGLATSIVDEIYHSGYAAKRMEIGAVIAAAPAANVRRERPSEKDVVILLGGSTGRDGVGGATGSSKAHDVHSVESCGAEVQKGNATEERKLQRLFRNPEATRLIKRCNDFGAGGVSVAVGELAEGLDIDLDVVPKKYEGLDGTELAISESQERMAVVVEAKDAEHFLKLAASENLQAVIVAKVKAEPRLTMRWSGKTIVDISREFLDSNGAPKHIEIELEASDSKATSGSILKKEGFTERYKELAGNLNTCSKRGLVERFDSTIGGGAVLMPFGGKYQRTPIQAMVNKIPLEHGKTTTCSAMAYGYNPFITEKSAYHGAYLAVVESVSKLVASGASFEDVYLSFQEYFKKPGQDGKRWGQPLSALLGAFKAQMDLGVAAIGGKDSMSGTFENLDVPPTLVSFAVTTDKIANIISPEFKQAGDSVLLLSPEYDENGLPVKESLKNIYNVVTELVRNGLANAAYTLGMGGAAEAVMKMCFGNGFGFSFDKNFDVEKLFCYNYGAFAVEIKGALASAVKVCENSGVEAKLLGQIVEETAITCPCGNQKVTLEELEKIYEEKLESIFPCNIEKDIAVEKLIDETEKLADGENKWGKLAAPAVHAVTSVAKPKVLIPVFPGTNCEYDSARAVEEAGGVPEIMVIRNLTSAAIAESIDNFAKSMAQSQMIFIPGGFSGGDEPDGSGKFITSFFRNEKIKEGVTDLMDNRDGLICGICNGFQALIKLGLLPYGKIMDTDESFPTLTYNTIGRHQSKIIRTRITSNSSPWLSMTEVGEIYSMPISHGEGRFIASPKLAQDLLAKGQVATQYVDLSGKVTADVAFNPNNSVLAIEGITSPDGRVFGKMGHCERKGYGLYKNVSGNYDNHMFEAAVKYFK